MTQHILNAYEDKTDQFLNDRPNQDKKKNHNRLIICLLDHFAKQIS